MVPPSHPTLPPVASSRPKPTSGSVVLSSAAIRARGLKPLASGLLNEPPTKTPSTKTRPDDSSFSGMANALPAMPTRVTTPPFLWGVLTPPFTLPVLMLALFGFVGYGVTALLAAPLPDWSSGLGAYFFEANNPTGLATAWRWDSVWYHPQVPWAIGCGAFFGPRLGWLMALAWVVLAVVGLPLMASGGGPTLLLQPTFGFALGLGAAAATAGWLLHAPATRHTQTANATRSTSLKARAAKPNPALKTGQALLQKATTPTVVQLRRQQKRAQQPQASWLKTVAQLLGRLTFLKPITASVLRSFSTQGISALQRLRLIGRGGWQSLQQGIRQAQPTCPSKAVWPASPSRVVRFAATALGATAAAHATGWAWLSVMAAAQWVQWEWMNPMGPLQSGESVLAVGAWWHHWGQVLSVLSWGYDAVFGLCAIMVAQTLRVLLGFMLHD